ncbi:MAG: hypothetical protein KC621_18700 [Myxococcales bacterium]|nr:hypothetical protein [Myxococcales bacterium]
MHPALLLLPTLAGCSAERLDEVAEGDLRHLSGVLTSSKRGIARATIPVEATDRALLVTAQTDAPGAVHVRSLTAPDHTEVFSSTEWNDSPYNKTNGGFLSTVATLNWPVSADDPGLEEGDWEIELGVVDADNQYVAQDVAIDVLLKQDDSLDDGRVHVAVLFTDGAEDDSEARDAVDGAKQRWAEIYAAIGIEVVFEQDSAYDGSALEAPALAVEQAYATIASRTGVPHVNLVVSEDIVDFADAYGIAGDIPGPLVPSTRSAVQVSLLDAAGIDGHFSDQDIRILGETMAHESGHFLGLFHPVEGDWQGWDVLDDTPECDSTRTCLDELGTNLMFPVTVCSGGTCIEQDDITADQGAVTQRYTGTE